MSRRLAYAPESGYFQACDMLMAGAGDRVVGFAGTDVPYLARLSLARLSIDLAY